MIALLYRFFSHFSIACGVIAGASVFAGLSALLFGRPPLKAMLEIASSLKIWAAVIPLGGTFSSFEALEQGLFGGNLRSLVRQALLIIAALAGANAGYSLIRLVERCSRLWTE